MSSNSFFSAFQQVIRRQFGEVADRDFEDLTEDALIPSGAVNLTHVQAKVALNGQIHLIALRRKVTEWRDDGPQNHIWSASLKEEGATSPRKEATHRRASEALSLLFTLISSETARAV